MYKTKFREWGYVKYNRKADVVKMLNLQRERAAVGKRTTFTRNGRRVDLESYLKRKGVSDYEIAEPEPALKHLLPYFVRAKTPEPVPKLCRTPQAAYLRGLYLEYCQFSLHTDYQMDKLAAGSTDMSHAFWDQIEAYCWRPMELFFEADWLLTHGHTQEAGLVMRTAFAELHDVLRRDGREWLLIFTYLTIVKPGDLAPALELLRYLSAFSAIVSGKQSLLHRLSTQLKCIFEEQGYQSYVEIVEGCGRALLDFGVGPTTMKSMVAERLSLSSMESAMRTPKISGVFNLGRWTLVNPQKHVPMRDIMHPAVQGIEAMPHTTAELIATSDRNDMFKSYCFMTVARHQRALCGGEGAASATDPRHELARYYMDRALYFSSQDFLGATPVDLDAMKLLETWLIEAGDHTRAADIRARHRWSIEGYLRRIRSIQVRQ